MASDSSRFEPKLVLPKRADIVVRKAHILSVDREIGNLEGADVHVRDGMIIAVGVGLDAGDAAELDGSGMIVMPGFVDTHWHLWSTLFRNLLWAIADTTTSCLALLRILAPRIFTAVSVLRLRKRHLPVLRQSSISRTTCAPPRRLMPRLPPISKAASVGAIPMVTSPACHQRKSCRSMTCRGYNGTGSVQMGLPEIDLAVCRTLGRFSVRISP